MNTEPKIDKDMREARALLTWCFRHPFATRREIFAAHRVHGVRTESRLYSLERTIQALLTNDPVMVGHALVHYHSPVAVEGCGEARDFWIVTRDETAAAVSQDRAVRHIVTRALTVANKAENVLLLASVDPAKRKRAMAIQEFAFQAEVFRDQYFLMEVTSKAGREFGTSEIARTRARWNAAVPA